MNDRSRTSKVLIACVGGFLGAGKTTALVAATGIGVTEWVDALLGAGSAGERILEIDYDTYAQAEAALGWFNATIDITATKNYSPKAFAERLMTEAQNSCAAMKADIAHLKILVVTADGCDRIAVTNNQDTFRWSSDTALGVTPESSLIINARVQTSPQMLTALIERSIAIVVSEFEAVASVQYMESFSPSPPRPSFRFSEIVRQDTLMDHR